MNQISVGGNLQFFISEARNPSTLVKQYHKLIGTPQLPPQWMLGWHQAKFGYKTLDEVKEVVSKYEQEKIPLEAIWNDISYMEFARDFTVDQTNYKGLGDYVKDTLHMSNKKYVPIINAGIAYLPLDLSYKPYVDGVKDDVFIKDFSNSEPFIGKGWSGSIVYPDWTKPKTQSYWET